MHGGIRDVTILSVPKSVIILVIAWGGALAPPVSGGSHPEEAEGDTGC